MVKLSRFLTIDCDLRLALAFQGSIPWQWGLLICTIGFVTLMQFFIKILEDKEVPMKTELIVVLCLEASKVVLAIIVNLVAGAMLTSVHNQSSFLCLSIKRLLQI